MGGFQRQRKMDRQSLDSEMRRTKNSRVTQVSFSIRLDQRLDRGSRRGGSPGFRVTRRMWLATSFARATRVFQELWAHQRIALPRPRTPSAVNQC